jgi:uncharacterized membrane protein
MFVMDMLIPVTMIILGRIFRKQAPEKINHLYGYRTSMSMKNRETWEFAHEYFGRIWYISGFVLLVLSAAVMLSVLGQDVGTVGTVGGILCAVQCIPLIVPVIFTEIALRKNFDSDGRRKWN